MAGRRAALLVNSDEPPQTWRQRLNLDGPVYTLPLGAEERTELRSIGAACAAAAARLLGAVSRASLEAAIRDELDPLGAEVVRANLEKALWAYDLLSAYAGTVPEGDGDDARGAPRPAWIELPLDAASVSAPDIHAPLTSVRTITGAWRTMRPVIEPEHCHRCWWVCSTFCPDGAISVSPDGMPVVDYDHCKGCLVCVAVCPHHAIRAEPERAATETGAASGQPGGAPP
jgi:pyruvate ferredoxin oxidoreductase gamma subunit